jgi:hypothetical protein
VEHGFHVVPEHMTEKDIEIQQVVTGSKYIESKDDQN